MNEKHLQIEGVFLYLKKEKNDFIFKLKDISLQREKVVLIQINKRLSFYHLNI